MYAHRIPRTLAGCLLLAGAANLIEPELAGGQGRTDAALWYQHVETLASPAFEGRAPGTHGIELAADFIESHMRDSGLQPVFPKAGVSTEAAARSFRQPFRVDGVLPAGVTTANVAGLLPGKGRLKGEYLVIGGHYDHLGRRQGGADSRGETALLLGADDNASGTAAVLILAQRLAAVYRGAPEGADLRSLIFIAFTAEESGQLGSRHFVQDPPVPLREIKAMLNLDMVGRLRGDHVSLSGFGTAAEFAELLRDLLTQSGLQVSTEQGSGASDQMSFLEAGIPALYAMTGGHDDIHQPTDLPSSLNPAGAAKVIGLVERIAERLSGYPGDLTFAAQPDIGGSVCRTVTGPEAKAGAARSANDWPARIPDTLGGRCAAAFLAAFNTGDGDRMRDFETGYRAASARASRPVQDRIDQFKDIRGELGNLTFQRVVNESPTEIVIVALSSHTGSIWSVGFELEDHPPHGLVTLRFKPALSVDGGGGCSPASGSEPVPQTGPAVTVPANGKSAQLPDTPGGRCVRAFLAAFDSGADDPVQAFEKRYRAASALANRSIEDRVDQMNQIRSDLGSLTLLRVVSTSATEVAILALSSSRGEVWNLAFQFEDQPPNGLVGIRITPSMDAESAAVHTKPIDTAFRQETIKQICDLLRDGYVNPDIGKRMADALAEHEAAGQYNTVTSAADLAQRLTTDVLAVYKDNHLSIVPFTGPGAPRGCGSSSGAQDNYTFRKAEILPGNIGYIQFDMFLSSDEARDAAAAALDAVAGCDALIFDLRDNVGGSPRMVEFLASYLFDTPTLLATSFDRLGNKVLEIRTLDSVPGKRFSRNMPVYVLTSGSTASAAEGFAYDLKNLGRATIVGARTSGAAHMVTDKVVNERFLIHLPYLREVNPITKGNWEGVGVDPDIHVPASEALDAARKAAADRLRAKRKAVGQSGQGQS